MFIKNLHEWFPTLDITWIPRYPNGLDRRLMQNVPQFDGNPTSVVDHIEKFIRHASDVNVIHLDNFIELFIIYMAYENQG